MYQPMNQIPQGMPGQMPTYGNQTSQAPYNQIPSGQMPHPINQMPPGQISSYGNQTSQAPYNQMPHPINQIPQGQWGPGQAQQGMPGQWGPAGPGTYPQSYPELPGNKRKKVLILSIVVSLIAVLAIITAITFPKLKEVFGNASDKESEESDERDNDKKDEDKERLLEEEDEKPFVMADPTPTTAPANPVIESDFFPVYSYSELPDVLSLDSDERFILNDSLIDSGIATYQFFIVGTFHTENDFIDALDNYSYMLQQTNGFIYEQQFSEEEYANSGDPILYLTRGDDWLSIVPSYDENAAYVHIYNMANLSETGEDIDYGSYFYDTYLDGRNETEFTSDSYVTAENGDLFYLNDVYSEDLGDGTKKIEVSLDLAGYYTGLYLNDYDFVILSKDLNGNIITDASPIVTVRDPYGNELSMPLALNADSYESYSLIFYIPEAAEYITLYATNTNYGVPAGTLYYTEYSIN